MKYSLTPAERRRYIGFDDRLAVLFGIPLLSVVSYVLFVRPGEYPGYGAMLTCLLFSAVQVAFYWVILRAALINLRARFPGERDIYRRVVILGSLCLLLFAVMEFGIDPLLRRWLPAAMTAHLVKLPVSFSAAVALTLCTLVVSVYESIYFFTKYRQSVLEQERLARANVQTQLSALQQQVNPHFLFNSLNTLATIIPEDPRLATRFVQRLAAVYRRLLEYRHEDLIPLREELTALEDYIFLLKTRC